MGFDRRQNGDCHKHWVWFFEKESALTLLKIGGHFTLEVEVSDLKFEHAASPVVCLDKE